MRSGTAKAKKSILDLACLGGQPLFSTPRPIGQLDAPALDDYLASLRTMVGRRRLTNDGPFVQELESRLATYHGVSHCIALANAALGIAMLLRTLADDVNGEVVMPAFITYSGLPHLAKWAGQRPRFVDVDPATHALDPDKVAQAINSRTTAILAVSTYNNPGDIDGLSAVARNHNIPLVIDSVYATGATYHGRRLGSFGRAEVFSLHATKLLNGFEGGYVTTDDLQLAQKLRYQRNFCYGPEDDPRIAPLIGLNAKLNEAHAAMALLSLDRIDEVIAANHRRLDAYGSALAGVPGLRLVGYPVPEGEVRNCSMVVVELESPWPIDRNRTLTLLKAEGLAIGPYCSPPLHELWPDGATRLPVTEAMSTRFMQLPAGSLVSFDDIRAICDLLQFIGSQGLAIEAALAKAGKP